MNKTQTQKMDMLHGPLTKKLLLFTLPIACSSILQQLFHAADTSMIGYFGNADALAAVGTNGEIIALVVTLSSGLSIGANVLTAKKIGEKSPEKIPAILHTSIAFALLTGILGMVCGICIASPLLSVIRTPARVMAPAKLYLKLYFLNVPFLLLYDFGSAILRARGDSRFPFLALTISGIVNVLLNLCFVVGFHTGVSGVAVATDLSTVLSASMVLYRLHKDPGVFHLSLRQLQIDRNCLCDILKTGIPSAIQGAVFCFANIFVQASVNSFGAVSTAGSTIAMNFEYLAYYVITSFGQTATTFTSQNFAAGQKKRCRHILGLCLASSVLFSLIIIVPIVIFREAFSGLFSTDPAVIANSCTRILYILFFEPVCCLYEIPSGVLRGTGHPSLPAAATVLGTCAFRIIWIFTVFRKIHTLKILFLAFPLSWAVTILLVFLCFPAVKPFGGPVLDKD